ncbi:MAG: XdhC family protein [Chloroflexota bacterium]
MRDILAHLARWHADGKRSALATVVQTWGSSPRRAGAKMAVTAEGQFCGSVSGGCVENAAIEAALDCLKTDRARLLHFGVADETAWDVGLACGGSIDIFVQPLDEDFFQILRTAWAEETTSAHVTVIRGAMDILGREMLIGEDGHVTRTFNDRWSRKILELASEVLSSGKSRRTELDAETEIFIELIAPPPTLIAVGGVHISVALVSLAKTLGFRTVVIDPRGAWGNQERFPNVDQLIQAWPKEAFQQVEITRSTAIAMLTHDPKLDDPALKIALASPAFYVGALGSKTTNAKRRERLLTDGMTESHLSRLHAPIGLDIGAESPEEIALAIMSEVVDAYRNQSHLYSTAPASVAGVRQV